MINETNVKCFLSLAQTLSFTRTSKELFMTQQAVSQQISKLEAHIGIPLFVRSKHYVALTNIGKDFYDFFREMSDRYKKLEEQCHCGYTAISKTLNVGFQDWTVYGQVTNAALNLLIKQIPEVEIEIVRCSPGELANSIKNRDLQVIILYDRWAPHSKTFRNCKLMEVELNVLVSEDYPGAEAALTYRDFRRCPLVVDSSPFETLKERNRRIRRLERMLNFEPSEVIVMPNWEAAKDAVKEGTGIFICTDITRITPDARLKVFSTGIMDSLCCVWRVEEENAAVMQFARCLQNAYTQLAALKS